MSGTTFYMRSADDNPHLPDLQFPSMTKCGLSLDDFTPVSDIQVMVYLGGRSCQACTPHIGVGHRFSAPALRRNRPRRAARTVNAS